MLILHTYIAKDLLRTFAMTALALTLLVVLGGGVANLFKGEGLEAEEIAQVFLLLTPVAITLILPVAALFSAAITYGRAAADNEITACSAAGINIHRLLLSAFLLGLFISLFTYWSWNYKIPQLSGEIAQASRRELHKIVSGQFAKAKPLAFGKYRLMANTCVSVDPEALGRKLPGDHAFLRLTAVSFLEVEDDEILRYGTSDETVIDFDKTEETPRVTVDLRGVRTFDTHRRQYYELEHQVLGPFEIPLPLKRKIKFEPLDNLLRFRDHPQEIPEVKDRLSGLSREMMAFFMAQDIYDALKRGRSYTLLGPNLSYEISGASFRLDPHDGGLSIRDVTVREIRPDLTRTLRAGLASFDLKNTLDRDQPDILVDLTENVEIRRIPPGPDDRLIRQPRQTLQRVPFIDQPTMVARVKSFDMSLLLQPNPPLYLPSRQARQQAELIDRIRKSRSEVVGEIHFRASYALNALAVVLFGAILAIIARGGQVLTAFGISCLPMVVVVVASMVGRNLADRPNYTWLSLTVMWSGTALIYLATAFIGAKFLKR